jgi:hypothetical protein
MTARDVEGPEPGPRRRSRSGRDFGLVVGVDHYPRFRSLQGAAADAIAFHAWMCAPDGGGVAPEHARLITSTPVPPTPLQDHVDEQVVELVQAADALGGARRLYVYADLPDVAILQHAYAPRARDAALARTAPPLLRASLQLAMTHPAFDLRGVPADSALARAACRGYADSIWCTWSHDVDDERWIAPTVAELRRDEPDVVALGRRLGIPPRRVQQALDELDAGPSDTARG